MSEQTGMCPQCGKVVAVRHSLTVRHRDPDTGDFLTCFGSEQNPRNPESDARWLWNGKPNPHLSRPVSS